MKSLRPILVPAAIAALALITTIWLHSGVDEPEPAPSPDIDTLIPAGFVLVPIEVQNQRGLDSLIGQFAVVDLYSANQSGRPLARGVRLLRAPRNPEEFGVLVRESSATSVLAHQGPVHVVVQNREFVGKEIEKPKPSLPRNPIHEEDSQ